MKFTINKNIFLKHLLDVQKAVSLNSPIPILTGIKLNLTNESLILTGSNANISIEKMIETNNEKNHLTIFQTGKIVVSSKLFCEIIKKLSHEIVEINLLSQNKVEIISGKSIFTINGLDATLYPVLENIEQTEQNTVKLPTFLFKNVLFQTSIAASLSENRPILTGINITIKDGQLTAIATDSHRMSKRTIDLPNIDKSASYKLTIPAKSLNDLVKIISDEDDLTMILSDNKVLFISNNLYFYSRLLEGNYTDISRLLIQEMETYIKLNADTFLKAIERVSIVSLESKTNTVTLQIKNNNEMILSSESSEVGYVEETIQPLDFKGKIIQISFNPNYIKDALKVLDGVDIQLNLLEEDKPFTLYACEDQNKQFIQLITPIRTR